MLGCLEAMGWLNGLPCSWSLPCRHLSGELCQQDGDVGLAPLVAELSGCLQQLRLNFWRVESVHVEPVREVPAPVVYSEPLRVEPDHVGTIYTQSLFASRHVRVLLSRRARKRGACAHGACSRDSVHVGGLVHEDLAHS